MKRDLSRLLAVVLAVCLTAGSVPAAGFSDAFSLSSHSQAPDSTDRLQQEALIAAALWALHPLAESAAASARQWAGSILTHPAKLELIPVALSIGMGAMAAVLQTGQYRFSGGQRRRELIQEELFSVPRKVKWEDPEHAEHAVSVTFHFADASDATVEQIAQVILGAEEGLAKRGVLPKHHVEKLAELRADLPRLHRHIRQILARNPWALVARDPDHRVVGIVFSAFGKAASSQGLPAKMFRMGAWQKPAGDLGADTLVDFWFTGLDFDKTGGNGAIAQAMLVASEDVARLVGAVRLLAYSNPRSYPKYLEKNKKIPVETYAARVVAGLLLEQLAQESFNGLGNVSRRVHELIGRYAGEAYASTIADEILSQMERFIDKESGAPHPENISRFLRDFKKSYALGDLAITTHMKRGAKLVRIIPGAFPDILGKPGVGAGYSFVMEYDLDAAHAVPRDLAFTLQSLPHALAASGWAAVRTFFHELAQRIRPHPRPAPPAVQTTPEAPHSPPEKLKRTALRDFFIHNDGIDFATTAALMSRTGVLALLSEHASVSLPEVILHLRKQHARVNAGYVNIGMRLLADQGWVTIHRDDHTLQFRLTAKGRFILGRPDILLAYAHAAAYLKTELSTVEAVEQDFPLYPPARHAPSFQGYSYEAWIRQAKMSQSFGIADAAGPDGEIIQQIKTQLWGTLLGPSAAAFEYNHLFDALRAGQAVSEGQISLQAASRPTSPRLIDRQRIVTALELFVAAGWMRRVGTNGQEQFELTPSGKANVDRAGSYGVPVSYLPMLSQLETLYFGPAETVFALDARGDERHVARNMNLLGTKSAHKTHFKTLIPWLAAEFNKPDLDRQPQFIADMGSGDGSFLRMAYEFIRDHTERGKHLDAHPLWLIGADLNEKARVLTANNLRGAGIRSFDVLSGDINDPESLARELHSLGLDPAAGIHTSTFLIHNRPYRAPAEHSFMSDYAAGAFVAPRADYAGEGYMISNDDLDRNFLDWMGRWKPLLERFGMFFIELHSLMPDVAVHSAGESAATSYHATHFYSGQYIVPIRHFLKLMAQAGMALIQMEPMPKKAGLDAANGLYHYKAGTPSADPKATDAEILFDRAA